MLLQIVSSFRRTSCVIPIILLLQLSMCHMTETFCDEGKTARLEFTYQEQKMDIEIEKRGGYLIYRDGRISESVLSKHQHERFSVNVTHVDHVILIQLSIQNVSREDEGEYICNVYKGGYKVTNLTKQLDMTVNVPPGKVACKFQNSGLSHVQTHLENDDTWAVLECSSTLENQEGLIACYNEDGRLQPVKRTRTSTNLVWTVWVKKTPPIFCCSLGIERVKNKCDCQDFKWDPESLFPNGLCSRTKIKRKRDIIGPRQDKISQTTPNTSWQFQAEGKGTEAPDIDDKVTLLFKYYYMKMVGWLVTFLVLGVILTVVVWVSLCIFCVMKCSMCKWKRKNRKTSVPGTIAGEEIALKDTGSTKKHEDEEEGHELEALLTGNTNELKLVEAQPEKVPL